MQLTLPDGHPVHLTPWLLRAVGEAFPLPSAPARLVPFILKDDQRAHLLHEGLAEPTASGDLVLTGRGAALHTLLTEPGRLLPETEEGRPTPDPDLAAEQQQEIRAAWARLEAGDHGLRPGDPLKGRANRLFWSAYLPLLAGMYALEWFLEDLGLWRFLALLGLWMLLMSLFIRAVHRYRTKEEAKAPEQTLAGYEGRYVLLKELDSPSRQLLLRAQQAVDASPNPSELAAQEWDLAKELARITLRRREIEASPDPDQRILSLIDLLATLTHTEKRVRELEQQTASQSEP